MRQSVTRDALRRIEDILAQATGRALGPEVEAQIESVLERLVGATGDGPAGENFAERDVTILLADLRGFTSLTATYPAGMVLELLNRCFVRMSEIIVRHGGTIDKFMGDSIMVIFFGERAAPGADVRRALHCAIDMQLGMEALNVAQRKAGTPELFMGIGINTGKVMAGLIGSDLYSAYTVIGQDVNLASRIEAFSLRGQVLMSEGTYRHCADYARAGEEVEVYVKGRAERVRVRELLGIPSLDKEVPRQEVRRSPRVDVRLPFSYQVLNGKIVLPERHEGVILDIGYHGVLVEAARETLELHAEVKLELFLPLVGYRAADIYARVVKAIQRGSRTLLGLEFTSVSAEADRQIQLFVQMLIQGGR
ncbi:MAG TPA: adenylate/guanylate cyclase domain-containing protein [Burkholderiales bacterium]|nr:adenylate/guanylate cyclase domain-containing protein [Burkholderiales bacterium]